MSAGDINNVFSRSSELRQWYRQPLGDLLCKAEQEALAGILPNLFGYHLLLIAPPWGTNGLDASRIPHRVVLQTEGGDQLAPGVFSGHPEELPIVTDSLDALILPHTLELAADPHQVLREADRCLIPEGHVIILGFNPMGTWGMWRVLTRWRRRVPWKLRFFSASKVKDWLSLLGFDTVLARPLFFRPPLSNRHVLDKLSCLDALGTRQWMAAAGGYVLVARKRVVGITPIRPRWQRRPLIAPGLVEPTQRVCARG